MALDFPSNPVTGQTFNGFSFDGTAWSSIVGSLSGIPAGSIMAWSTATPPANWLICDGSAVSRSTYASLFYVIGTTYGAGNGSTTFNLPDLRGRVPVGKNGGSFGTLGATGGEESHTLTIAEMPSHTHTQNAHSHGVTLQYWSTETFAWDGNISGSRDWAGHAAWNGTTQSTTATNQNTGGGGSHNNLQPYQVVNYIIKYSSSLTPGDSELATRVGAIETTTVRSVALGGTGTSTLASGGYLKGNGTSAITSQTGIPASDITSGALSTAYGGTGNTVGAGLNPIIPSSVSVNAGTASVSADGWVTASGALTSISIEGCFPSAYRHVRMMLEIDTASGGADVWGRFKTASTTLASGYNWWRFMGNTTNNSSVNNNYTGGDSSMMITRTSGSGGATGYTDFFSPNAGYPKRTVGQGIESGYFEGIANQNGDTGYYTGLTMFTTGVTLSNIRIKFYGYR